VHTYPNRIERSSPTLVKGRDYCGHYKPLFTATPPHRGPERPYRNTSDGMVKADLSVPKEMGGPGRPNTATPEHLFAAGYAACFGGSLEYVARQNKRDASRRRSPVRSRRAPAMAVVWHCCELANRREKYRPDGPSEVCARSAREGLPVLASHARQCACHARSHRQISPSRDPQQKHSPATQWIMFPQSCRRCNTVLDGSQETLRIFPSKAISKSTRSRFQVHHGDDIGASILRDNLRGNLRRRWPQPIRRRAPYIPRVGHPIGFPARPWSSATRASTLLRMTGVLELDVSNAGTKSGDEGLPTSSIGLEGTALAVTLQPDRNGTSCAKPTTAALQSRLTRAMIGALQRTDPRCGNPKITPEDAKALQTTGATAEGAWMKCAKRCMTFGDAPSTGVSCNRTNGGCSDEAHIERTGASLDEVAPDMPLLWAIRDLARPYRNKFGCGMAFCGVCTVHVDGKPVRSCSYPVSAVAGRKGDDHRGRLRPGGPGDPRRLDPQQRASVRLLPVGQIMSAIALLAETARPSREDIETAMSGNLCRCGTL